MLQIKTFLCRSFVSLYMWFIDQKGGLSFQLTQFTNTILQRQVWPPVHSTVFAFQKFIRFDLLWIVGLRLHMFNLHESCLSIESLSAKKKKTIKCPSLINVAGRTIHKLEINSPFYPLRSQLWFATCATTPPINLFIPHK